MSYNGGMFIIIVLGLTTGNAIFGFLKYNSAPIGGANVYAPSAEKCCPE